MAKQVKDPVLSQQQLRSLLRCRFDPWPGNWVQARKKKKKKNTCGSYSILQTSHICWGGADTPSSEKIGFDVMFIN